MQHRWPTRSKNTTRECSAICTMSSWGATASIPTTCTESAIIVPGHYELFSAGFEAVPRPCTNISNWIKGLVRCQNCQKNGNIMWAGMTGTARVILVILEAEFFYFLDQGCTIHMQ